METLMPHTNFEESMTKVFSLIDSVNTPELERLADIDEKIYDCYHRMSIYFASRDGRPLSVKIKILMQDYNLPAYIIKKIVKKAFNQGYTYQFTDDEIEKLIDYEYDYTKRNEEIELLPSEQKVTKVLSLIDNKNIFELENLSGVEKKMWDCYCEMEKYIQDCINDKKDFNIDLLSWMGKYKFPANPIRRIFKKALNNVTSNEYTDDEVKQFIDENFLAVNTII